jgi:hypothetical protein
LKREVLLVASTAVPAQVTPDLSCPAIPVVNNSCIGGKIIPTHSPGNNDLEDDGPALLVFYSSSSLFDMVGLLRDLYVVMLTNFVHFLSVHLFFLLADPPCSLMSWQFLHVAAVLP